MDRYIMFDVDGTLNRTELYAVEAYQKALLGRGIRAEREDIISFIGASPDEIIAKMFGFLDKKEKEEWFQEIRKREFQLMEERAKPFTGIPEALEQLKAAGCTLVICSNNYPAHIERVLKCLGISGYFDLIGSLEMGRDKGEVLGKILEQTGAKYGCMVGDRKYDIEAARKNGIPFIGCGYGYARHEIEGADIVVEMPEELPEAVFSLLK